MSMSIRPATSGESVQISVTNGAQRTSSETSSMDGCRDATESPDHGPLLWSVIEYSPVAIILLDPAGVVQLWNPAAERVLGWSQQEAVGTKLVELERKCAAEINAIIGSVLETGSRVEELTRRQRKDGQWLDIQLSVAPVRDAKNNVIGILGAYVDVTQRCQTERALEASENRYRQIFESLVDVYFEADLEGRFVTVSPSCERMLGYTPQEAVGTFISAYIDAEEYYQARETLLAAGEIEDHPITFRHKDGRLVPLSANIRLAFDRHGAPTKMQGSVRDVSVRQRSEEALRQAEEMLRAVTDNIGIGIALITPDMRVQFLNRQLHAWFPGTDPHARPYCHEVFAGLSRGTVCNQCPTRQTFDEAVRHETVDRRSTAAGSRFHRIVSSPVFGHDGGVVAVIEMVEDVTDRKLAEEELAATTAEYMTLINAVPAVLYVKDRAHRFLTLNRSLCRLAGLSEDEMLGKADHEVLPVCYADAFHAADERVLSTGEELVLHDEKLTDAEGNDRWTASNRVPLRTANGEVIGVVALVQDITEQHLSRQHLVQADKLAAIGTLAAGVAHEINNPIGFVSSNLNTMAKYLARIRSYLETSDCEAAKTRDFQTMLADFADAVQESIEGTTRVRDIVADLKSFSRVDRAEKENANVNDGINSTLNIVWNELKYKCRVEKEFGELPDIYCMPNQLNQVFLNLLVNAGHAVPGQDGLIRIKTWTDSDSVYVSVTDNGVGIPPANVDKIFEPFFTTKEVGKGTGLGLSLAYDIVQKHGGTITVDSEVGAGSTFTVKLPLQGVPYVS